MTEGKATKRTFQRRARLWIAVVSSLGEAMAICLLGFWVLPHYDVNLPWGIVVAVVVSLGALDVFLYRAGTKALDRQPVHPRSQAGERVVAVTKLAPRGAVRLGGELWQARSLDGDVEPGESVVVVGQDRLTLDVRRASPVSQDA